MVLVDFLKQNNPTNCCLWTNKLQLVVVVATEDWKARSKLFQKFGTWIVWRANQAYVSQKTVLHLGMVPVANIPKHVTSLLNTKNESKIRLNMTSRAVVQKQTNKQTKNTVKLTERRRQIIFALRVISSVDRIVLFNNNNNSLYSIKG